MRGGLVATLVAVLMWLAGASTGRAQVVYEAGFEAIDGTRTGWIVPAVLMERGVRTDLVSRGAGAGDRSLVLHAPEGAADDAWANVLTSIQAEPIRGKRFRLRAMVRVEPATPGGRAQLWARVDLPEGRPGFFDNMNDRPIVSDEWAPYEIVGRASEEAEHLVLGLMLFGGGRALLDDVSVEVLGDAASGDAPPGPLEGRALENVCAMARLFAVVEQFHPSTEAQRTGWLAFGIDTLPSVESAPDAEALAQALRDALAPIAPGVDVWAGDRDDAPEPTRHAPTERGVLVGMVHNGRGANLQGAPAGGGIYRSHVQRERPEGDTRRLPDPPDETVFALGAGVWARVPHVLVDNGSGTLPRPEAESPAPLAGRPTGWRPGFSDRSTRVVAAARAWGVLRHFYPYFDVVDTDWEAVLPEVLAASAEATDAEAYIASIERMAHALHDGHAMVSRRTGTEMLAFKALWLDGRLVVVRPIGGQQELSPGDVVTAIAGEPVGTIAERLRGRVSASTPGFAGVRLVQRLLETERDRAVPLEILREGERVSVEVPTVPVQEWWAENGRAASAGEEVAPGVMYVNLHGLEWGELEPRLPELAAARGVVFDLRGYPNSAGTQILRHLSEEPMRSAWWKVPVLTRPFFEGVEWGETRWTLEPADPQIEGRVAFITDGRAISYAETCLAIVEAYGLGEIVGGRTAGTNGNVNSTFLADQAAVLYTGMRVVKHDDETVHQGVGVLPTIEVYPTLEGIRAGRDELLERAIEVVSARAEPSGSGTGHGSEPEPVSEPEPAEGG